MTPSEHARVRYNKMIRLCACEPSHETGRGRTRAVRSTTEVAQILGISRQAVHQVERAALYKLRVAMAPFLKEINPELHHEMFHRNNP